MVGTARLIEITKVSYQVQSTDACLCYPRPRVLVRCATISRQLRVHVGQGRLQSRGSPLFMINHRSSISMLLVFSVCGYCSRVASIRSAASIEDTMYTLSISSCGHIHCTYYQMDRHADIHVGHGDHMPRHAHIYVRSCIIEARDVVASIFYSKHKYRLDINGNGSMGFRNPKAWGCSVPSEARALLGPEGFYIP